MWERYSGQYKKTFLGMQTFIALTTMIVHHRLQSPGFVALWFVAMQLGALGGAVLGTHMKDRRIQPTTDNLINEVRNVQSP